jgi:hypothetical protein|tara:strand:- start:1059 stop:1274 length:216 start_codon:yes stop_codon:yes gene_type:complete
MNRIEMLKATADIMDQASQIKQELTEKDQKRKKPALVNEKVIEDIVVLSEIIKFTSENLRNGLIEHWYVKD